MRIMFFIRSLEVGGSEQQLVFLANRLCERGHKIAIVLMYPAGELAKKLSSEKIEVFFLKKKKRWHVLGPVLSFLKFVKLHKPEIIHSYGTAPNLLLIFLKFGYRRALCVWGVRASYLDLSHYDYLAKVLFWLEPLLARGANLIIANSNAGRDYATSRGFPGRKVKVIENGIETEVYKPDAFSREEVRNTLGVKGSEILLGFVGRPDPIKDQEGFVKAVCEASRRSHKILKAISVGCNDVNELDRLQKIARNAGLEDRFYWLDESKDVPRLLNGMDFLVSSSYGEGFSNVIAEAMSTGVLCVATDVGDSARIVGSCGIVVAKMDIKALADGILKIIAVPPSERVRLAQYARERIIARYSINRLTDRTEKVLQSML